MDSHPKWMGSTWPLPLFEELKHHIHHQHHPMGSITAPSLGVFKSRLGGGLGNLVQYLIWRLLALWQGVGTC